ncbi:hypothetical protein BofuT4_P152530.1 [Botrytis cinerea T4]|uniref:Uncharacterized protein n=1 Tax=Botryotinia fuckeliana (strain T4) TaxID=999810 RepID=G2YVP3_BOTF4|nr:hypothetical protein BofuT4_P152530.1 [Botrytis cinerea T4]
MSLKMQSHAEERTFDTISGSSVLKFLRVYHDYSNNCRGVKGMLHRIPR